MPIRAFACAATVFLLAAQPSSSRFDGRVLGGYDLHYFSVEVSSRFGDRVPLARDGSFSFHATPGDTVELRVVDAHGDRLHRETLVLRTGHFVEIRLPAPRTVAPPAGPISIARLGHKPLRQARKHYDRSAKFAEAGHLAQAVEEMERSLKIDPGWMEAWVNLGSRRLRLHDYTGAETAFRRALAIDPNTPAVHANLGLALLFLGRTGEAEQHGRAALRLSPADPRAQYVTALAILPQNRIQALTLLRQSAPALPAAADLLRRLDVKD